MKPYDLDPEAAAELESAINYYENARSGLGGRFRFAIDAAFEAICRNPWTCARIEDTVFHEYILEKFPYSIVYEDTGPKVMIYAVSHHSRKPFYWSHRTTH